jgi:excisionase family DNA binding protein
MEAKQQMLTVEEAAFLLKVGVPTVEALIRRELLPAQKHDTAYHIRREDLVELMRRNQREIEQNDDGGFTQDFGVMGKRTDE